MIKNKQTNKQTKKQLYNSYHIDTKNIGSI